MTRNGFAGTMLLLVAAAYLVAGVAYASSQPLVIAGMTGPARLAGLAAQVVGWPLMLLTHPT